MASLPSEQSFVCRANDADTAWVDAALFEVAIHDVGDSHAGVEVVEHGRPARAAPRRDAPAGGARPVDLYDGGVLQGKAETPLEVEVEKPVGTLGLNVEDPLAAGSREETHA